MSYTYLGHPIVAYNDFDHCDAAWPLDPNTKERLVCPLGYAPMVWPPEKPGRPAKVYFHWPTQIEDIR